MALKKPGELFGRKVKEDIPSISVDESFPHIKEEFHKVEDLRKQIDSVSSSLNNSLTEVVDKNLNFLSKEYSEQLNKFNKKIDILKEEIDTKVDSLEKSNQYLKAEIEVVEQRQQTINLNRIKKEVISEVENLLSGDVSDNIKRLEEKIEVVRGSYQQTLNEGLLNEPPSTKNSDPLTPLDKDYVTLQEFQAQYKIFLNRIQQQMATIGGGGAVNIQDMDDVDLSSAKVNGKYLKYNSSTNKWEGADATGGGGGSGITTANVSTNALNVIGLSTHRNGINVAGLSYLDGDVSFVGDNTNAIWDKSKSDLVLYDNTRLTLGSNEDFQMWHGGSNTFIKNTGGDLRIRGNVIKLAREDSTETYIECNVNNAVQIFYNGNEKLATTNTGINVTGDVQCSDNVLVANNIKHHGDTDTYIEFTDDQIRLLAGGKGILTVTEDSVDSVVINNGGNNCDFRVEGLNDEHLIFSDGGTDSVGIGTSVPTTKFDISGSLNASGLSTFRNGLNVLGLLHTNDNVNFTGDAYNLSWDKSDNALEFTDNAKATFGAGNDLEIHSNGTTGVVGGAVSFTSDITVGTSQAVGVVLTSPDGTKYRLVVANDGTLSTSAV